MTRTLRAFSLLAATALSPAAAQPLPVGPEILAGTQAVSTPSVALGADGSFAAAWHPRSSIGAPFSLGVVRTYSPAGHPLRADAAGLEGEIYSLPRIAALPSGRYAAAWISANGIAVARILDVSGAASPSYDTLELGPAITDVQIDSFPSGGFVTAWKLPSGALVAQRVDHLGRKSGGTIQVANQALQLSLAAQPDGGFVVAWTDNSLGLFYRIFGPTGTPRTSALRPTTALGSEARVSADAGGHFVISWAQGSRIVVRRFRADGQAREAEITVADAISIANNDVAMRPDGSFLVLWTSAAVYASIYDSAGEPVGGHYQVHNALPNRSLGGEAAADESGWVVSWFAYPGNAFLRRIVTTCGGSTPGLCLAGSRYRIEASWHTPATGARGTGRPVLLSEDTGAFWFFSPENLELMVKVLDGGPVNGRTWVFYSSLTDVEFELTVTDRVTGEQRVYRNTAGTMASRADTDAFPAPTGPLSDALPHPSLFAVSRPLGAGPQIPLLDPTIEVGSAPWVTTSRGGSFTAVWQSLLPYRNGYQYGVAARTVGGGQSGPQAVLSPLEEELAPFEIRIDTLASGETLAIWTKEPIFSPSGGAAASSGPGSLLARRLDASGEPVAEEVELASPAWSGDTAAEPDGRFVLAWNESYLGPLLVRRFNADGTPAGAAVQVADNGLESAIEPLPGGRFLIAWTESDGISFHRIYARVLGPDLTPQGSLLEVIGPRTNQGRVRLSSNASGQAVLAWTDGQTNGRFLARRFDPATGTFGETFEIHAARDHALVGESVALRPDGSFLALWSEYRFSWSRVDARARLYRPDGTPFGAPFRVQDELTGLQWAGAAAATPTGWVVTWSSEAAVYARQLDSYCQDGGLGLCLNGGRFRVEATWHVPATGARGTASPIVLSAGNDTGALWFFEPTNYELTVKVLDGRELNGHFWVFYASLTDVEFDLTITDTVTGQKRTYHNPPGTMASRADTQAFPE